MTIRRNKSIDTDLYRKIVDEIKFTTLYMILYFQGEPLMHEEIFDMIGYASGNNIFTATSTNGQNITPKNAEMIINSGLDRLIISIDGADQATYEKYRRGGSINKILDGTRLLSDLKKKSTSVKPEIIFQFLVFKHNVGQIEEIKKLGKMTGANKVWIKSAQIINPDEGSDLIPDNPEYARYEKNDNGTLNLKGHLKNHCGRLWRTTVITTDGFVIPCCFDKNTAYVMGDLNEKNLNEIWNNHDYKDFRKRVLKNRRGINICNNCTEGVRVYL
jgi:radical SAM protein with 4Fe4S-binding SPASM domain